MKKSNKKNTIKFPKKLLVPVRKLLKLEVNKLNNEKLAMEKQDPFADKRRVTDNASPDTDAEEQTGHARVTAIKNQINRNMIQTKKALSRLKMGKYGICENCGNMINTDRLVIYPEATLCVKCERKKEK